MIVLSAEFVKSASGASGWPPAGPREYAFCGRSNVGKSSALNALAARKALARVSRTPGRTRLINFFDLRVAEKTRSGAGRVEHEVRFADLPGYGYAAVPRQDKIRWQQVMASYLVTRENLSAVVLLCDPRHGLTELDDILLEVIRPRVEQGLKFLLLLTKADKLNRAEANKALSIARATACARSNVCAASCALPCSRSAFARS